METAISLERVCVCVPARCVEGEPPASRMVALTAAAGTSRFTLWCLFGCTDPRSPRFSSCAILDDGSCGAVGCTDRLAMNFRSMALVDDGSCLRAGCIDPGARNYDSAANIASFCEYDPPLTHGCTDPTAANFVSLADVDDKSCVYSGCTHPQVVGYDSRASLEAGACVSPARACADPLAENYDPRPHIIPDQEACRYFGCTDPTSPYFSPKASFSDECACGGDNNCARRVDGRHLHAAPPLVSVLTLTVCSRRAFLEVALRNIAAQTYSPLEVVVVQDHAAENNVQEVMHEVGGGQRPVLVRYVRQAGGMTVGAKRNLGVDHARGELIVHWEDDALFAPRRIWAQVRPILQNRAVMTSLGISTVSLVKRREYSELTQYVPFMGSLVYRSSLHDTVARFPYINVGEDVHFATKVIQSCRNRHLILRGVGSIYTVHEEVRNTWEWEGLLANSSRPSFLSDETESAHWDAEEWAADNPEECPLHDNREDAEEEPPTEIFTRYFPNRPLKCCQPEDGCPIFYRQRRLLQQQNASAVVVVVAKGCSAEYYDPLLAITLTSDGGGCTDPTSITFNSAARIHHCDMCYYRRRGCMDPVAYNYDSEAVTSDGSCVTPQVGCMLTGAPNFDPDAEVQCSSCCDSPRIHGCTHSSSPNFNPLAQMDDGSCIRQHQGCMDPMAKSYDPSANAPTRCEYDRVGCMDSTATNYDRDANLPHECSFAPCYQGILCPVHIGALVLVAACVVMIAFTFECLRRMRTLW